MAQIQNLTVLICDGCGRAIPTKNNEVPKGFYGKVEEIHPDGNSGEKDFFAHTDRCIKNAILNVLGLN